MSDVLDRLLKLEPTEANEVSEVMLDAIERIARLESALSLIAAPMRPDGTWNRDREACRHVAEQALKGE